MSRNIKEDAEFYRLGLESRLCTVEEAIAWCDAVIMEEAEPDVAIIDASLEGSSGSDTVAGELRGVKGKVEEIVVLRRFFAYLLDLLVRDQGYGYRIAAHLTDMTSLYNDGERFPGVDWSEVYDLDLYFEMPDDIEADNWSRREVVGEEEVELTLRFLKREGR
ncbi:hypothetical protein EON80_14910 [bacterium]|nr:MAG: hypothetical protein EON80_14910 [bacterium]